MNPSSTSKISQTELNPSDHQEHFKRLKKIEKENLVMRKAIENSISIFQDFTNINPRLTGIAAIIQAEHIAAQSKDMIELLNKSINEGENLKH